MSDVSEKCPRCGGDSHDHSPDGWDCLLLHIRTQRARIAELQAIVDKLPTMADGIRFAWGDTVWRRDGRGRISWAVVRDITLARRDTWIISLNDSRIGHCSVYAGRLYSTQKAAEAANG